MVSNERQLGHPGEIRHASVPKASDRQEGQETVRDRRGTTPGKGLPCHPLDDHQESLCRARSRSSLRFVPGSENPEQDAKGTAFFRLPGDGSRTERVRENWLEHGSDDQKQGSGRGRRVPEISCQGLRSSDLGLSFCQSLCRALRRSTWVRVDPKFRTDG